MNVSKLCIDTAIDDTNSLPSINSTLGSESRTPLPSINELSLYINQDRDKLSTKCLQYQLEYRFLEPLTPNPKEGQTRLDNKHSSYQHVDNIDSPLSSSPPKVTFLSLEANKLKKIIEQCTMVYQKIGIYRADPLREAERNQIMDDVFNITENMLIALRELEESSNESLIDLINRSSHRESIQQPIISINPSANIEYELIRQARNLQKNARPKYRRRNRANMTSSNICHSCNTTDTPEWRRGPDGARTLCNACGLHYAKLLKKGSMIVQTQNYTLEAPPSPPPKINK
ncbi:GATA zinc finger-domain-containing protein [Cokeromyces recurvatus]|uniref:GATA zinc finger-domain-containing protein n=1 Tax=Cokeromyces recurvatus TaxID=90255 RepID=UPI00221FCFE8|nr:GATA zinc finger-domain-containing protein [Cokeromyces recurvatus]KAI7903276.1 GATA zinc finger-domain-containing protein [Cokeromyces recurvatus]